MEKNFIRPYTRPYLGNTIQEGGGGSSNPEIAQRQKEPKLARKGIWWCLQQVEDGGGEGGGGRIFWSVVACDRAKYKWGVYLCERK